MGWSLIGHSMGFKFKTIKIYGIFKSLNWRILSSKQFPETSIAIPEIWLPDFKEFSISHIQPSVHVIMLCALYSQARFGYKGNFPSLLHKLWAQGLVDKQEA